jgi:hypothetical protein
MNKQISALLLSTSIIFFVNATASEQFAGLTKSIEASADAWIKDFVSKLDITQQLMYLNLFIQPSSSSVEATMKCLQQIQADPALTSTSTQFEQDMHKPIERYIVVMQKKFEALKQTSQKSVQNFLQKLEKKIYELMGHIYGIYYTKLYKHIEQQNPEELFYMFNEQGLIAPENRTKALPKPAL